MFCPGRFCFNKSYNREMRFSWQSCNYSEIFFWFSEVWSLVSCSFTKYLLCFRSTCDEHRKNRKRTLFFFTKNTSRDYEKEKRSLFWVKLLHQSQSAERGPKKAKNFSIFGKNVLSFHRPVKKAFCLFFPIYYFSLYSSRTIFWVSNDSFHCTPVFGADSVRSEQVRSRQRNGNQLRKNSPCYVEFATSSETKVFEQSSSERSSTCQSARNNEGAVRNTFECRRSKEWHNSLSGVSYGKHCVFHWRIPNERGYSLSTRNIHYLFPFNFRQF